MSDLQAQAPSQCQKCGHDPNGDDDEWTSGGGWSHASEVMDGLWIETLSCHRCGETVARVEKDPFGVRQ